MADPNFFFPNPDYPYNNYCAFTNDFTNVVGDLNLPFPLSSPLIPMPSNRGKDVVDFVSMDSPESWDSGKEFYLPGKPDGNNGETSNQIPNLNVPALRDLPIQIPFPFPSSKPQSGEKSSTSINIVSLLENPFPLYSQSRRSSNNEWGTSNHREINLGKPNLPTPEALPFEQRFSFPSLISSEALNPLQEVIILGRMYNKSNAESSQAGCSKTDGETSNQIGINLGTQTLGVRNSRQLDVSLIDCNNCELLREIVHMKGRLAMNLQIHGKLPGVFLHAILQIQLDGEVVSNQAFNFYGKGFEEVKQFLNQYCFVRMEEGFIMMKDPHSAFFEVLCVGFDWDDNQSDGDNSGRTSSTVVGGIQINEPTDDSNNQGNNKNKVNLIEQRKRVKQMTFKDLAKYFHISRKNAAKQLGLSETVVHNIYSRYSTKRWPFRKVQSLQKDIYELCAHLKAATKPEEKEQIRQIIKMKEIEMANQYKPEIRVPEMESNWEPPA